MKAHWAEYPICPLCGMRVVGARIVPGEATNDTK